MDVLVEPGSSRCYFSFDVFLDGNLIGSLKNFTDADMVGNYVGNSLRLGEFSKKFILGTGTKNVCIYLPWSAKAVIKKLSLDDNSTITSIYTKETTIVKIGEIEKTCTICGEKTTKKDFSKVWILPVIILGAVGIIIGIINYIKMMKKNRKCCKRWSKVWKNHWHCVKHSIFDFNFKIIF